MLGRLLPALTAAVLLAACGGGSDPAPASAAPPVPGATTLDATGGSVTSADQVRVTVPPNALGASTTIRIAKDSTGAPPWGEGLTEVGDIYALTPHGLRFDAPVEVRLPIPPALLGAGDGLAIAKAESGGDRWTILGGVRRDGDALVTQVDGFSYFRIVSVPIKRGVSPFVVDKTVTSCTPGDINPFGATLPGCGADAHVSIGLRLQTSGLSVGTCDPRSPVQLSVIAYPLRDPSGLAGGALRFDRIVLLDKRELTGSAPVDGSDRPPIPQTIDLSASLVPWVGHPFIWIEVTTDCLALGSPTTPFSTTPTFAPVTQQWGGALVSFSSEATAPALVAVGGASYAPLRWVRQPTAPAGVEGLPLTIGGVLAGGASLGSTAVGGVGLTGTTMLPVRPATALDSATVDWERSDDGGLSWRTMARSWEHEADPDPFASGRPWRYWGVGSGLRNVTRADADALYRGRACYTLPGRTPSCTLSNPFRLTVAAVGGAPIFGTVSASQLVRDGQTASFTAVASGLPAPALQWRRLRPGAVDYEDIPGATAATYTTAPATLADNGTRYRAVASNGVGTATSPEITLSVSAVDVAPTILTQPSPLTVGAGSEAVFAVNARGTEALSYQWRKDGVALTGANSAVLKLPAVGTTSAGSYSVVVSNGVGSQTSASAALTVTPAGAVSSAPSIVTPPVDVIVNAGNTATFGVGVSGSGPFSFQWRKDGAPIAGATAAVLTLAGTLPADAGSYSVQVGNSVGSVTSSAAALTVAAVAAPVAPSIGVQPSSIAVAPGASATLAVAASGSGPLSFQWSKDGAPISGATTAVLTLGPVSGFDGGVYTVTVSNSAGTVVSSGATLVVIGAPAITAQPAGTTAAVGATATFSVTASGDALRYQWTRDNVAIGGATGSSYTTPALTLADSGAAYGVVVYNGAGVAISSPAVLTVTAPAALWRSPLAIESDERGDAQQARIAVSANGDAIAVWFQSDGTTIDIYANRYTPSGGWETAQRIESSPRVALAPQIAIDGSGNAIAVWEQVDDTGRTDIWTNRYVVGSGWGTAELLDTGDGQAGEPQIAMDGSGNAFALWVQRSGISWGAVARRYVVGSGWGAPQTIESDTGGDAYAPQIAVNARGDAVAVWTWGSGSGFSIRVRANSYVAGTGWVGSTALEGPGTVTANPVPQVAIDAAGNAIAVWQRADAAFDNIWSNRYVAGVGWGSPTLIETDDTNSAINPKVAMDAAGNAIAVWMQNDGVRYNVLANRYTVGSGWGGAGLIEGNDSGSAERPQIVIDGSGHATVVWSQRDEAASTFNIWANRYTAGSGWGSAQVIDDTPYRARLPQLGVDAAGRVLAVWEQWSVASVNSIWAGAYR